MNMNHASKILLRSGRNLLTCPCRLEVVNPDRSKIQIISQSSHLSTLVQNQFDRKLRTRTSNGSWVRTERSLIGSTAGIATTSVNWSDSSAASSISHDTTGVSTDEGFKSPFIDGGEVMATTGPAEVPFPELGLSHGYPSGYAQTLMEYLHIDLGLEWWQVICTTTLCLRFVVFPIVVIAQKNMVTLNNHQPEIQKLQIRQQMAAMRGELENSKFIGQALHNYMMVNNCHPVKSLFPIITQGTFFATMFFGIRGMTNAPVPSLTTGGLAWFTDLTMADPTYVLPVLTASTIYLQLYLGADGLNTETVPPLMKKILYLLPVISIPVMTQFPAALNLYWLTNNIISVCQARFIRHPPIREKLGIGEMIKWKPEDLPATAFHEELKREMAAQRSKQAKLEATIAREKKERQEEEKRKRAELLKALDEEEAKRAQMEAKKSMK